MIIVGCKPSILHAQLWIITLVKKNTMDNHLNLVKLKWKNLYSRILKMIYLTQCFFVPIVGTKAPVESNNTQDNETNHHKVDDVKGHEGE